MTDSGSQSDPARKKGGVVPPVTTFEGVAKVVLGTAAGALLLYAVWKSIETGTPIREQVIWLLAGLIAAFLGVDFWAIIQRAKR